MILLDTNVLVYADDRHSTFFNWSRQIIADASSVESAVTNPIVIAELCVGETDPAPIPARIEAWGVILIDLPVAASLLCANAYRLYRQRRLADSGRPAPDVPLPDFFIGAHAAIMGWELATADPGRFKTYFPEVTLLLPEQTGT
ncbi:MAG: type II toxin-antitoxin system VapC family toxin [Candidatus Hydrogenedentes bacterium]|nr:type II toxin-antitoxin system VapC family toxin [Candidatus Hydrogenedentota bacterium]